jgi:hypothetical protein
MQTGPDIHVNLKKKNWYHRIEIEDNKIKIEALF